MTLVQSLIYPLFGVLFTFPSRYWFAIGLLIVFSLGGWCRRFQTGFLRSRPTQGSGSDGILARTGLSPCAAGLPRPFRFECFSDSPALQPRTPRKVPGLGSAPFARRYLGYHCCFLFLRVLRCFSSPRSPPRSWVPGISARWVAPFGNPRIDGHLRLPAAYRSLSRPSSPSRARASPVRP